MRAMIVGGTFDRDGGRASKIVGELARAAGWPAANGGTLEQIENFDFNSCDALLWMPNVDNAEKKILPWIKEKNGKLLLISTKRVVEKQYHEMDVIGRLLKTRSNLGIMIERPRAEEGQAGGGRYRFKLLDPLGNQFCDTADIPVLAAALTARVAEIRALTRIGSVKTGEARSSGVEPEFVKRVIKLGDEFSRHVNAVNPARFLGNASTRRTTRCCHGFPAQRGGGGDVYLVSRRNVDKQTMSAEDFVEVGKDEDLVRYYGDRKPSVDSPIQIRLFNRYANVNYIVHGHVYVDGAPSTHSKVPCGHVEEFGEIAAIVPDKNAAGFCVNLKGHGCLIMAKELEFLDGVKFIGRPFPEV